MLNTTCGFVWSFGQNFHGHPPNDYEPFAGSTLVLIQESSQNDVAQHNMDQHITKKQIRRKHKVKALYRKDQNKKQDQTRVQH